MDLEEIASDYSQRAATHRLSTTRWSSRGFSKRQTSNAHDARGLMQELFLAHRRRAVSAGDGAMSLRAAWRANRSVSSASLVAAPA